LTEFRTTCAINQSFGSRWWLGDYGWWTQSTATPRCL